MTPRPLTQHEAQTLAEAARLNAEAARILAAIAGVVLTPDAPQTTQTPVGGSVAESDAMRRERWRKASARRRQRRKGSVSADSSAPGAMTQALTVSAPSADQALTLGADALARGVGGFSLSSDSSPVQQKGRENKTKPSSKHARESAPVSADGQRADSPAKSSPRQRVSAASAPPGFDRFWTAWPSHHRKTARPQCLKRWRAHGCEDIADAVIAAVEAAKGLHEWTKDGGQFIPAPLVWLNQRRWEAPPPPTTRAALSPIEQARARRDEQTDWSGYHAENAGANP